MVENGVDKTQLTDINATQMVSEPEKTQMAVNITCPVCGMTSPGGEQYCVDCGFLLSSAPATPVEDAAPQPLLPKMIEAAGGREFLLKPGENIVGRQDADVLLAHPTVSRKHARLTVADGIYTLEDLGSSNGTFVAGKKIEPGEPAQLEAGTDVLFGSAALKFEAPAPDVAISAAEAAREAEEAEEREEATEESIAVEEAATEPLPPPVELAEEQHEAVDESEATQISIESGVEFQFEATPGQALEEPIQPVEIHEESPTLARLIPQAGGDEEIINEGENTVGRRPANKIVIADAYTSGSHAVITASEGVFTLIDLGSTNGTLVNGEKLAPNEPRELDDGDEITFGQTVFRFTI